ncbi:GIY-YIG nuclease family protein [Flavobacterium sp.]|uniref:GIY-YIG nuclease family protein n=1 Tax=Flavobacterium sp. TaxID=239 RepID=UPI004047BE71
MKGFFVYMFLDNLENPLYIGISINLINRIETQHFKSTSGNLSQDCIFETNRILYHQAISLDDMKIKERYLINKLTPKYNEKMNNNNKFTFDIDIDWKLLSLNTEQLIEVRNKKNETSGKKIINHKTEFIKVQYSWLDFGFYLDEKENSYFKIFRKERIEDSNGLGLSESREIKFILVNGEFYISDWKNLGYYCANYKEISKLNKLDKEGFISVVSLKEFERCKKEDELGFTNSPDGLELAGESFMKFEIVKKLEIYPNEEIILFEKKLEKLRIL